MISNKVTLNKHIVLLMVCTTLLLSLAGCATQPTVFSDFDARHDFTKDETFGWVQNPPLLRSGSYPLSALAESRMTAAIKNQLIMKGYTFVDNVADADLSVVYTMGARDKIEFVRSDLGFYNHRNYWGWGVYYYPYFVHYPFDQDRRFHDEVRTYTKGDIAIDIFDAKTKQPIWHAKASKNLSKKDLNSNVKNAQEIVENLLQDFPIKGCAVVASDQCRPFE